MLPIPTEELFLGIIGSVEKFILPELHSPYARGQARAIVGILRNLSGRLVEAPAALEEENSAYEKLLRRVERGLVAKGSQRSIVNHAALRRVLRNVLRAGEQTDYEALQNRNRKLKSALASLIQLLGAGNAAAVRAVRPLQAQVQQFFLRQLEKEARRVRPVRWKEIASAR